MKEDTKNQTTPQKTYFYGQTNHKFTVAMGGLFGATYGAVVTTGRQAGLRGLAAVGGAAVASLATHYWNKDDVGKEVPVPPPYRGPSI